jgi:A/G-specific adenine glycosylase
MLMSSRMAGMTALEPSPLRRALRAWYRPRREGYPWRRDGIGPYAVLVSEVMLQQTQAARVAAAFDGFLRRFPNLSSLAAAAPADVLRAWSGLGYHRRAVALHEAARTIIRVHGGEVPGDPGALQHLRGVGPYTASAVAAIAFGRPVVAMDVNVRRVASRVVLGREPEDRDGPRVAAAARVLLDRRDPATWNQAMMDLGRDVCRPAPRCEVCPLEPWCRFRSGGRRGRSAVAPKQSPFEGSNRQVRGRIVAVLRERPSAGLLGLAAATGFGADRVGSAVTGLVRDGIVERRGRSFRLPVNRPSERSNREPGRSSDSFSLSAATRPEG